MGVEGDLHWLPRLVRKQVESSDAFHAWDVDAGQDGARALAVDQNGVLLFAIAAEGAIVAAWSEVEELSFPGEVQLSLKLQGHEPLVLTLMQMSHRLEIASAVPHPHRERLGLGEVDAGETPSAPVARPMLARPLGASTASTGDTVAVLWRFFGIGLALQILGGVFLGRSWPSSAYDFEQADIAREGNTGGLVVGWLLGGAGTMIMFVTLIGFGAMMGIRAAKTRS